MMNSNFNTYVSNRASHTDTARLMLNSPRTPPRAALEPTTPRRGASPLEIQPMFATPQENVVLPFATPQQRKHVQTRPDSTARPDVDSPLSSIFGRSMFSPRDRLSPAPRQSRNNVQPMQGIVAAPLQSPCVERAAKFRRVAPASIVTSFPVRRSLSHDNGGYFGQKPAANLMSDNATASCGVGSLPRGRSTSPNCTPVPRNTPTSAALQPVSPPCFYADSKPRHMYDDAVSDRTTCFKQPIRLHSNSPTRADSSSPCAFSPGYYSPDNKEMMARLVRIFGADGPSAPMKSRALSSPKEQWWSEKERPVWGGFGL